MWRCEDEKMWRWEGVKMRCEEEQMWRWEDVKMWGWIDVKMRRCEDEKVWRWCEDEEDVKIRCEDEKMRYRIHYWKNLRSDARSWEKRILFLRQVESHNEHSLQSSNAQNAPKQDIWGRLEGDFEGDLDFFPSNAFIASARSFNTFDLCKNANLQIKFFFLRLFRRHQMSLGTGERFHQSSLFQVLPPLLLYFKS